MANSLQVSRLNAGYGAVRVLEDISLSVSHAETVVAARHQRQRQVDADEMHHGHGAALFGQRSSPKSTASASTSSGFPPRRSSISASALVPEGRRLFPKLTVEENLLLGAFRPTARSAIAANLEFLL